jgi:hypothetical protein
MRRMSNGRWQAADQQGLDHGEAPGPGWVPAWSEGECDPRSAHTEHEGRGLSRLSEAGLPAGVHVPEGLISTCWADRVTSVEGTNPNCLEDGTGPLGLCPAHHEAITGQPVLLSWGELPLAKAW